MRSNRVCVTRHVTTLLGLAALWPLAAAPRLKYVVIVSRHGVRAPTWDAARLKEYSVQPWPEWGVAPAELTPRGNALIKLMGAWYGEWLAKEGLLNPGGCRDAGRIHIVADSSQRTVETGRAFAASLLPGCAVSMESRPPDQKDPLFSGTGAPDGERSLSAVRARLGDNPQKLVADFRPGIDALQFILSGGLDTPKKLLEPAEIGVSLSGKTLELTGPFNVSSTMSENLLLEYANGFQGTDLGWGRLTRESLSEVLELHAFYADVMRRTGYPARARGSNLLEHILLSLEQSQSGKSVSGALGRSGDVLLVLSGHDTNISNLSGMLGLSWSLPGYQPDDTPPGGALIFSLWHDDAGGDSVTAQYVAQSLDQMRNSEKLTMAAPPESRDVSIPGCKSVSAKLGCSWDGFKDALQKAIDPAFVAVPEDKRFR